MITIPLERFLDRSNRVKILLVSAAMIGAVALVDWLTLPYVSLGCLYLFPIMLTAGFVPRTAIVALGVGCAVLSEAFSSLDPEWRASRLTFETMALAGGGLFLSELIRNRQLNMEMQERLRALVETSPAAIVTVNGRGIIELANQAAAELLAPEDVSVKGQSIGAFLPELENVLQLNGAAQFRASMECLVYRAPSDPFLAEVWFSTYNEGRASKLAAIIADISEGQAPIEPSDSPARDGNHGPALNERQTAVLRLVLEGLRHHEMAARLDMTSSAVKNTLRQLYAKAGVHNRSQMVRFALEHYRDVL